MIRKFELSLARDYVPGWTLANGVREFLQNALDQEATNSENKWSWSFAEGKLRICNKKSTLTTRSLLLGGSTKVDDQETIGQFGEGYKVATLVLLRLGKSVTIYNYGAKEVWRPRFVKSKRFGADVLTFFVDTGHLWDKAPSDDLIIEIGNISQEEWQNDLQPSSLHLQAPNAPEPLYSTDLGDVYNHAVGDVYVNGLFVCNNKSLKYSYNFDPSQIQLDRDRKLVSDFELHWMTSKIWKNHEKHFELLEEGVEDVKFISGMYNVDAEGTYKSFLEKYGDNAFPVTDQSQLESVDDTKCTPIIVNKYLGEHLRKSVAYASYSASYTKYDETDEEYTDIEKLLIELKEWFIGASNEGALLFTHKADFKDIYNNLVVELGEGKKFEE